jgi:hypothetical protein
MAAGYRSYAFRWFTGYAAGGSGPVEPGCECPPWKMEQTLTDAFYTDQTLDNAFRTDETLDSIFKTDASLGNAFRKDQTLTNQWQRKACD